ncbi:MAG: beta-lactamase family protein [Chitinophagaceae bacterium]|nr:beta-lactamase family protein [Chitinophagaceae bacterium]
MLKSYICTFAMNAFCCLFLLQYVPAQQTGKTPGSDLSTYQPPVFKDTARMSKVKKLMPLVEKMYKSYAVKNRFPGLAFGVVMDGELLYAGNFGYTNFLQQTKVSSRSLFRIASMSKSFTAMAILKLRDEGRLRLDEPASKYIPVLKNIPLLTKDAPAITIRNLMTHTAGFPEDNPWGDRQLDITDQVFQAMLKNKISFSNVPGTTYEYSNMGFAMLGEIIRAVSGKSYQQYINEQILKPLGMTHTFWEYTQAPPELLAHGYRLNDNIIDDEPMLHDGVYGAMGGLITSIEDFSKYMLFHLSAWPARNDAEPGVIKRSSVREMHQPWSFNNLDARYKYPDGRACPLVSTYGYGLRIGTDCEGRKYVGHTGGLPGFGSQWWILPDYGIGVVAFGNLTYAGMNSINFAVMDTLIKSAKLTARELPVSPVLQQRKAALMALLPDWNNAEKSGIFAVNFFPDEALELRKKKTQAIFAQAGKIRSAGEIKPENQLRGTFVIECEHAPVEVYFTLSPENPALIQQLDIKLLL